MKSYILDDRTGENTGGEVAGQHRSVDCDQLVNPTACKKSGFFNDRGQFKNKRTASLVRPLADVRTVGEEVQNWSYHASQ